MPDDPEFSIKLKDSLRAKLAALVFIISLIPLGVTILLSHQFLPVLIAVNLVASLVAAGAVWWLLKPLESLFQSVKIFGKGEFSHRVNIPGKNEFANIAQGLNQMATNLINAGQNIQNDHQTLIAETSRWQTIFSTILDGIIVVDIHRKILMMNKAAEAVTGYTAVEAVGKLIDEIVTLAEKDGRALKSESYCPIYLTGDVPPQPYKSSQAVTITNKSNQRSTIRMAGAPIMVSPQANLGCVVLLQDAASEREFESIQLDFVSMASHELRTPLTSIIGYLSIFMDENKLKLDPHQTQFLDRTLISARQLASLIENLLNVSKVERGALRMVSQSIDWIRNLTQVVTDNQIQASQKNITLKLEVEDPKLPGVKADNMRINEVLNNLITNAINYTEQGGSITVSAKREGQEIITSVKDTGRGIPKEALPHLFTKFFRVSTALSDSSNSKGTGLGLFLSKSIIDLNHGRIWAESEIGKGSTFLFSLPLVDNQAKS